MKSSASFFKRYLLPGFAFQSLVIAGGYGTGRELVEFFLSYGPTGGLMGMMLVSMLIWSLVCACSFEFSRCFAAFEYRTFFKKLLGRFWVVFEISYLALGLIVLAVVASAAGSILEELTGLPYVIGVVAMMGAVGLLVFFGSSAIEQFFAVWSFALYGVYIVFFVSCLSLFGDKISDAFAAGVIQPGWFVGGVSYSAYNLGVIPAVLFVMRHQKSRRESIVAGLLAGPIAMIPALFFYLSVSAYYPAILNETLPANYLLGLVGSQLLQIAFQVILFGTLIETASGFIHAINERVAGVYVERGLPMPGLLRPALSTTLLVLGALIAQFGLIGLIAKGYGTITWAFLIVYVIPVLTLGVWKLFRASSVGGSNP